METISAETRIIDLTVGELMTYIKQAIGQKPAEKEDREQTEKKEYAYGVQGIAKIFNCSMATANRIKASGRIDAAISQTGRKMVIDVELALDLMRRK